MDRKWHEYSSLRAALRMVSSNLSSNLQRLHVRGYAETRRFGRFSYWRLTKLGEEKLAGHIDATRKLFAMAEELRAASHRISINLNELGDTLVRDYRAGATIMQIAEVRELTYYGARQRLLRQGVQLRATGPEPEPAPEGMVARYRSGATIEEVAEEYGLGYGTARRMLIKARAGVRRRGEPGKSQTTKVVVATGYVRQRWPKAAVVPRTPEALSEWLGEPGLN